MKQPLDYESAQPAGTHRAWPAAFAAAGAFATLTAESVLTVYGLEYWTQYLSQDGTLALSAIADALVSPLVSFAVWFGAVRETMQLQDRPLYCALVGGALAIPLAVIRLILRVLVGWETDDYDGNLVQLPGSTSAYLLALAAPSALLLAAAYGLRWSRGRQDAVQGL